MNGHPPSCFCEKCRQEDAITQPPPWENSESSESTGGLTITEKLLKEISGLIRQELDHTEEYLTTEIIRLLTKEEKMLPQPDDAPKTISKKRRAGALEYLDNSHLTKQPKEARIIAVRDDPDNKFSPRVILKLAMDGKTIFWGVAIKKNPNYRILTEKFGNDENDWVDQKVLLFLEQDEFSGQWYPRVNFPETKKEKK